MKKNMEVKPATKREATLALPRFTKQQLLQSNLYRSDRDLLNVVLKSDHSYTKQEVEEQISLFQKGMVN